MQGGKVGQEILSAHTDLKATDRQRYILPADNKRRGP